MDDESRPKRPWQPWQYILLVVMAVLLAILLLHPLSLRVVGPFQAITSALAGQPR